MSKVCCPKCDADISDTYEGADPSVGIMSGGYYCDACDLGVADHEAYEPMEGDVQISGTRDPAVSLGTPFSELASTTPEQKAKYENFKRIARSWGYD